MDYLLVIDNATGNSCDLTLIQAAALTQVDAVDIEQSIRTLGVCQSIDFTILDTEAADDVLAA